VSGRSLTEALATLQALVGTEGAEVTGTALRRDIERFARASGDEGAIHFDDAAAREAGYASAPAPPLMLSSILEWGPGPPLGELREDGTGVGRESWLPLESLRLMGGGQDLELHAPVYDGQQFVARPRLDAVELKEGGAGALLLMTITTEFRDPDGTPLVTCRETLIGR
jgi:acyl dehydratase